MAQAKARAVADSRCNTGSRKSRPSGGVHIIKTERFYNVHRPHGVHNGKPPYEALREKL